MTEVLLFTIGLLVGSISTYFIMNLKKANLQERILDELVKNRLLKDELGRKPKKFNGSKKKYYKNPNNRKNKNGKKN